MSRPKYIFESPFWLLSMIETINMLLLKKFEGSALPDGSGEFINRWLMTVENYQRLQRECDKIWAHHFEEEG